MKNRQNLLRPTRLRGPILGLAFGALLLHGKPSFAGGGEVLCSNGTEFSERWPVIPSGGLNWQVAGGAAGQRIAPGLPNLVPYSAGFANDPFKEWPGIRSIHRAAAAWSDADVPFVYFPGHPAQIPFPKPASKFKLKPLSGLQMVLPLSNGAGGINDVHLVQDGNNTVSLWESPASIAMFGGPLAIAVTRVYTDLTPGKLGDILEADIALNVRTESTTKPGANIWSFVEYNTIHQQYYATGTYNSSQHCPGSSNQFIEPEIGFVDLEGAMAHEFGHFAGLGHSLLDSTQQGSLCEFPTMFPYAQSEPFAEDITICDTSLPIASYPTVSVSGLNTDSQGILGRPAASLAIDDVVALGATYPTRGFNSLTGSISGLVLFDDMGTSLPLSGAHVVAVRVDRPDEIRISTLSYQGGSYTLRGLLPGEYHIYVEPVDQDPLGSSGERYFGALDVPEYLLEGTGACLPSPRQTFTTEFWDASEAFSETSPSNATRINVVKGTTVGGINLQVVDGGHILAAKQAASTYFSPRGVTVVPTPGSTFPNIEYRIEAGTAYAGTIAAILFNSSRGTFEANGQLFQLPLTGAVVKYVQLDSNGDGLLSIPTTVNLGHTNTFAQAFLTNSSGDLYSNVVNLWITNP